MNCYYRSRWLTLLVALVLGSYAGLAAEPPARAPKVGKELADQATASLQRGAQYLATRQDAEGGFGERSHPGVVGLCVVALYHCPGDKEATATAERGMKYILKFAHDDGSFHFDMDRGSYPTYTTSIVLLALNTINKPEYVPLMKRARNYLKGVQIQDKDSAGYGGFGYGGEGGGRADITNTSWVTEALYRTEYLDKETQGVDPEAPKKNAQMWQAVTSFLDRCQKPVAPAADGKAADPNAGSFVYVPGGSASGMVTSGSLTYAGLESMIYAKLVRDDVRVKGALKYLLAHYTVDENPGAGQASYYYYILAMAKALDAFGQDTLQLQDGTKRNWREDLATRLLALQQPDGSWVNTEGRHMESLPELVTAYGMIAVRLAVGAADPLPE